MKHLDSREQTGNVSWDVVGSHSVNSDLFRILQGGVPLGGGGEVCAASAL